MQYRLVTVLLLSLFVGYSSSSEPEPVRWGYVNFPPFHYSENGKVVGSIAEKIEHMFTQAGIQYTAYELPNKRTKLYIEQGNVEFSTVIESFISNPDQFLKSDLPIYNIVLGATCLKGTHQIAKLDDLKVLPMILMAGYTYGRGKPLDSDSSFKIVMSVKNHQDAIKALTYNRGECILGYQAPSRVESLKYPDTEFHFYPIQTLPVFLYLNKKYQNAETLMQTINQFNQ